MGKIFGIDLGTTYSCISYVDEFGKPVVVPNQDSSPVTPSVVAFEEGGNVSVGQAAKETLNTDPQNVCSAIKRQMGNRDYTYNAFGQEYTPEAISALILKKLAKDAGEVLGEEVKDVVITCPAYFGMDEREATRQAGEIAGLNVLAIINEPTAAAISYGLNLDTPQTVMVYDLGGGTFDVTIIKVANGEIRVVATGGDHKLGGKDWDNDIRDFVISKYSEMTGEPADSIYENAELMGELELKSETAKKQLTQKESAAIRLNGQKIEITREEFKQLTNRHLESSIEKMKETMAAAAAKGVTEFDKVLLVGGSTRMLQVEERLKQEFPSTPIEFCDPDQSVSKGAAIYGMNIAAFPIASGDDDKAPKPTVEVDTNNPIFTPGIGGKPSPIKIINVISQCVAVRLMVDDNGTMKIVNQIYKNTELPHTKTLQAGTVEANQQNVYMEFFENGSDNEYVEESECKPLIQGELGPLPSGLPKGAPIELLFNISEQGLLSIDAKDLTGGATKHLEVQLQNVLSKEDVEKEKQKLNGLKLN